MIGAADGKLMNAKSLQGSSAMEQLPCIALKTSDLNIDIEAIYLPLLGLRFCRTHRWSGAPSTSDCGLPNHRTGHFLSRLSGDDRRQTITAGCGVAFVPANRFVSLFVSLRSSARSKASGQKCPLHISKFNGKVKPGDDPAPSLRRAYVTLLRQGRT